MKSIYLALLALLVASLTLTATALGPHGISHKYHASSINEATKRRPRELSHLQAALLQDSNIGTPKARAASLPKPPQDLRDSGLPNGGKSYSASEDTIRRAAEDGHDAEADKLLRNIPANGPLTLEQTLTVLRRATRRASNSQQAESTPVQSKGQVQDHESKVAPQVRPVRAHQQGISQRSSALPEGVQRPPLEPPTNSAAGSESSPPTTRNEPAQLPVEDTLASSKGAAKPSGNNAKPASSQLGREREQQGVHSQQASTLHTQVQAVGQSPAPDTGLHAKNKVVAAASPDPEPLLEQKVVDANGIPLPLPLSTPSKANAIKAGAPPTESGLPAKLQEPLDFLPSAGEKATTTELSEGTAGAGADVGSSLKAAAGGEGVVDEEELWAPGFVTAAELHAERKKRPASKTHAASQRAAAGKHGGVSAIASRPTTATPSSHSSASGDKAERVACMRAGSAEAKSPAPQPTSTTTTTPATTATTPENQHGQQQHQRRAHAAGNSAEMAAQVAAAKQHAEVQAAKRRVQREAATEKHRKRWDAHLTGVISNVEPAAVDTTQAVKDGEKQQSSTMVHADRLREAERDNETSVALEHAVRVNATPSSNPTIAAVQGASSAHAAATPMPHGRANYVPGSAGMQGTASTASAIGVASSLSIVSWVFRSVAWLAGSALVLLAVALGAMAVAGLTAGAADKGNELAQRIACMRIMRQLRRMLHSLQAALAGTGKLPSHLHHHYDEDMHTRCSTDGYDGRQGWGTVLTTGTSHMSGAVRRISAAGQRLIHPHGEDNLLMHATTLRR